MQITPTNQYTQSNRKMGKGLNKHFAERKPE